MPSRVPLWVTCPPPPRQGPSMSPTPARGRALGEQGSSWDLGLGHGTRDLVLFAAGPNPRRCPLGRIPCFLSFFSRAISPKVRGSLPASMLRLVDSGGVQVEVTRIANGSVVVEFNLLITADVGVHEVSAAFLVAFQNASLLEVVGEDTVIQGRWRPAPPPPRGSLCLQERWGDPSFCPCLEDVTPCVSS